MPNPDCKNCGCKVKIDRSEEDIQCVKKEVKWVKKLMIGNLITLVLLLLGVVANLVVWLARTGAQVPTP